MTIGEALKRFRSTFKLQQKQIAEELNIVPTLIYKYESGKTKPPAEFILKLANTYDVSADYLLGRSDEPRPLKFDAKTIALLRAMEDKFAAQ